MVIAFTAQAFWYGIEEIYISIQFEMQTDDKQMYQGISGPPDTTLTLCTDVSLIGWGVGRFSSGGTHKSSVNECSYTVIETLPRSDPMICNTTVTAYLQNQGNLTLFLFIIYVEKLSFYV
jgi:hypothetical protein